jgi:hypothetical protein
MKLYKPPVQAKELWLVEWKPSWANPQTFYIAHTVCILYRSSMQITFLLDQSKSSKLTCSEIVQLLTEQPTGDETSHAHMHMLDGFPMAAKPWKDIEYAHTTLASKTTSVPVHDPAKG